MQRAMAIDTDVLYQWKDLVPTYKDSVTTIRHIVMRDVRCHEADGIYELNGDADCPVRDVLIEGVHVDHVRKYTYRSRNVEELKTSDITWEQLDAPTEK
jgi:hypothetical protein